jgi:serine/threonine-protein kinase RsbW
MYKGMIEEGFYLVDELRFSSDIANISEVENLIDRVVAKCDIHEDVYGNLLIGVTEAVNNAIVHGNHSDVSKEVFVEVLDKNTQICFVVHDKGNGFDFAHLPDPTAPENLEKPSGRGVFLMRNLADEVEFLNGGSSVALTFNRA